MSSTLGTVTCVPHHGDGLVARLAGDLFLLVGGEPAEQEFLLKVCWEVAARGGDGRTLVRALAGHATAAGKDMPSCVAMAPSGDRMVVFVHGDAEIQSGDLFKLSGNESLSWFDRLVPWPLAGVTATLTGSSDVHQGAYDLRDGAVPGAGFTLTDVSQVAQAPAPEPAPAAAVPEPAETPERLSPSQIPTDEWEAPDDDASDAPVADEPEPEHAPLPIAGQRQVPERADERPQVRGVYCKNNHFNDMRQRSCAVCGINMAQTARTLTYGTRPPLGVLVLDDGSEFQLDEDYVLGREPQHDESVASGRRRALSLDDDHKTVSRAHARIELHDWDVLLFDNGSANGTFVAAEGATAWQHVPPGHPYPLQTGTRVLIGRRTLIYNTSRSR